MKNLFLIVFIALTQFAFSQASTEVSNNYDKIGKFVNGTAFVYKGGMVGLIDKDGKEIIKPEYEKISAFGEDGIAYTHKRGKVGMINKQGTVIVENIYDHIGHFSMGKAVVRKDGLCGVINKTGKVIVDIKYDKLSMDNGVIK